MDNHLVTLVQFISLFHETPSIEEFPRGDYYSGPISIINSIFHHELGIQPLYRPNMLKDG